MTMLKINFQQGEPPDRTHLILPSTNQNCTTDCTLTIWPFETKTNDICHKERDRIAETRTYDLQNDIPALLQPSDAEYRVHDRY